jgi:hypothetical protein
MCDGVDGKTGEGGPRFGTIGRNHRSQFGHKFGRDNQLGDHGVRVGLLVGIGHDENQSAVKGRRESDRASSNAT